MPHSGWQTERFQLRFCKEAKAVSKNTEKKELSLEQAMARIEQILQILDSGQGTLDESLALFEEGTAPGSVFAMRNCSRQNCG